MIERHEAEPAAPRFYVWLRPGRLAIAERPGRGGRSHRKAVRDAEIAWWCAHGVTAVVSAMRSRHGLVEYALADLTLRWEPLVDLDSGPRRLAGLLDTVLELLEHGDGAVLVHADRANEWLAAIDAALRVALGLADDHAEGLRHAAADGLPVGSLATALVGGAPGPAP